MDKLEYYLQFKRFQQSREKHFGPSINRALQLQYLQFITALKSGKSNPVMAVTAVGITDALKPLYMDSIKYGAKVRANINSQKGMAIGFNDRMVQLMKDYFSMDILNVSEGIAQTTRDLIQQVFTDAIENGLSINEIVAKLQYTELSRIRARMIARTETVTAANQAGRFAAKDMGLQMNKEWLATMDNRTRHDHLAVNGQVVGADDYFTLAGSITMLQPGARKQETGLPVPAKEIINCRCTTLYLPLRDSLGRLVRI